MKKILISREETQYDIIVKNQGNALESASRVNQSKDVFTGQPIDVSTGIAKAIKPKKETIAQRKAKLLGGKAVSFAFNGLKISEHNE